jgi:hypothetical protein
MIEYVVKVRHDEQEVHIPKPLVLKDAINILIERAAKKTAGYLYLRLDLPRRPRTTGPRSQNNRFYGHCEDLAEQVLDEGGEPKYDKGQIHDAMLRMSVPEGYPTYLDLNGVETPLPSAQATVEQMNVVTKTLQRYADIHSFWLHEYAADGPHKGEVYRSIGGRSFEEMQKYETRIRSQ